MNKYINKNITIAMVSAIDKSEFIRVHTAGAVYCITDMIIFDVLKKIGDQYYLYMTIQQNEIEEQSFLFKWDEIPKNVMEIYEYVKSTSIIEIYDDIYTLYGNHIGRKNNHKYTLCKYINSPFQTIELGDVIYPNENDNEFINTIAENMRIVKCL